MNKGFFSSLACQNLKKNAQNVVPYLLTCIGTVMVFYMMISIYSNPIVNQTRGGWMMKDILGLGCWVIAIFAFIFLIYTSRFLVKQRKKEFAMFNILGMEKKHIFKIVAWETGIMASISLGVGMAAGILLDKLSELFLCSLLNLQVVAGFRISMLAIRLSIALFAVIFLCTLLLTIIQVQLANPIELLREGQAGEKEPKAKWFSSLLGAGMLISAYWMALTISSPIDAIGIFFIAVLLVMGGTYFLFVYGSIAILKMLKKNPRFYYKAKNFTAISGMLYRMKQNAVGLANICILSTMVLVILSSTVSLYFGIETSMMENYPQQLSITLETGDKETIAYFHERINDLEQQLEIEGEITEQYRYTSLLVTTNQNQWAKAEEVQNEWSDMAIIQLIPLEDFNHRENRRVVLQENEILLYDMKGNLQEDTVVIDGHSLSIKSRLTSSFFSDAASSAVLGKIEAYMIVAQDIQQIAAWLGDTHSVRTYIGIDTTASDEKQNELVDHINRLFSEDQLLQGRAEGRAMEKEEAYAIHGGLLFIGLFLGLAFTMATCLIIYYKQISEGYEDKRRFEIMQKVGMSYAEVQKTIDKQVLMVFFLPLTAAILHALAAHKTVRMMLGLLKMGNDALFMECLLVTIVVFAVLYALVYMITSKVYYRIVKRV